MKTLAFCWLHLLCLLISVSGYAEHNVLWTKLDISAELPAPYGKTSVAFLTSEHNDTRLVSRVDMSNSVGSWMFTHPEIHKIPIETLTYRGVIPIKQNCAGFQQNCMSFEWSAGEPRYITFADGSTQGYRLRVALKITEKGSFNFRVEDTYEDGVKLEQQYREFMMGFTEQLSESEAAGKQESIAFPSLPDFTFPNYYYGSRSFYYELPAGLGMLAINNRFVDRVIADYKLVLPSGNAVDVTRSIKEQGLNFSRFSSPLVSVDAIANTFTVTVACLLNDLSDETTYTAARFTIADNTVISTDFVRQATQGRVCELAD